ncbi:hypothetical protein [Arthrobacter sp. H14-L1]|nr:hypothetical protein [Arthrobacter sp. H14-L1]MCY0905524.1 hypothetical protein [Arthrobacter sp. H14-L1]
MITSENIDTVLSGGGNVVPQDGGEIGSIGQVYLDDERASPAG